MSSNIEKLKSQSLRRRKTALNDIRRVRNRKLAQLYCISNFPYTSLAEDDVSKISSYLQGFITDHSLESNKQMTEVSLLGNKHLLENILTNSRGLSQDKREKGKQSQMSNGEQSSASLDKDNDAQPIIPANQQTNALWNELNNKRRLSSTTITQGSESRKSRRQSKPTPQEVTSFELSKIRQLNSITEKSLKASRNDIFVANENDEKLLYMLMSENTPTTISPAIPLSKLFYYSRSLQLVKLLVNSNKVLTTNLFESSLLEGKISVVHSRIDELQKQNKWCLKQPRRYIDPFTVNENKQIKRCHWDNLLLESSWMASDFKESRKYKLATCLMIASAVMDYFKLGKEATCIKSKPIKFLPDQKSEFEFSDNNAVTADDSGMNFEEFISNDILGFEIEDEVPTDHFDVDINVNDVTDKNELDLILNENEVNIPASILADEIHGFVDPQSLHDLQNTNEIHQEVKPKYCDLKENFPFNMTAPEEYLSNANKLVLDKMDMYTPFGNIIRTDSVDSKHISVRLPGNEFKVSDIIPVSKLTLPEESDDCWFKLVMKNKNDENENISNSNDTIAKGLFQGSALRRNNTSIIKPPQPPSTFYLDARSPTIWVPEDDKLLLKLCKLYNNNWYVVSSQLSSKLSKYSYVANISRRTPWQCFERFSQLTSSFPQDLRGVYSQQAQNWFEQSRKLQISTKKRIWPLGVGKGSIQRGHRKLKWASMFEAMRRALKKRENTPKPVTAPASFRKQMSAEDRAKILSPLDLSKIKFGDFDTSVLSNHMMSNTESSSESNSITSKKMNNVDSNMNSKAIESNNKTTATSHHENAKNLANEKPVKPNKVEKKTKIRQNNKSKSKSIGSGSPTDTNITRKQKDGTVINKSSSSIMNANTNNDNSTKSTTTTSETGKNKKRSIDQVSQLKNAEPALKKQAVSTSSNLSHTSSKINYSSPDTAANNGKTTSNNNNGTVDVQKYFTTSYVSSVISDIQSKHPEWSNEEVRNAAARKIAQLHNQIKVLQQKKLQQQKQEALQRQQVNTAQILKTVSSPVKEVTQTNSVSSSKVSKVPLTMLPDSKSQSLLQPNDLNKNSGIASDTSNSMVETHDKSTTKKFNRPMNMNPALSNVLTKLPQSVRSIFENTNIADLTPEQKVEFINKIKKQMREHGLYGNALNKATPGDGSTSSSAATTSTIISNPNNINTAPVSEAKEAPEKDFNNPDSQQKSTASPIKDKTLHTSSVNHPVTNSVASKNPIIERNNILNTESIISEEVRSSEGVAAATESKNSETLDLLNSKSSSETAENRNTISTTESKSKSNIPEVKISVAASLSAEEAKMTATNEAKNKKETDKAESSGNLEGSN